jgi:hypothetical protein
MLDDLTESVDEGAESTAAAPGDSQQSKAEGDTKVRLEELPEFRKWQSSRDSERSALEKQLADLTAQNQAMSSQVDSLTGTVQQLADPDDLEAIEAHALREAENARLRSQVAQYQQRDEQDQADREWTDGWHDLIREYGLEMTPTLVAALQNARDNGYHNPTIMEAIRLERNAMENRKQEEGREAEQQARRTEIDKRQQAGAFTSLDSTGGLPADPVGDVSYDDINKEYRAIQESNMRPHEKEKALFEIKRRAREAGHIL